MVPEKVSTLKLTEKVFNIEKTSMENVKYIIKVRLLYNKAFIKLFFRRLKIRIQ